MRLLSIAALLVSSVAFAGDHAHWGYDGANGPEHWGDLAEDFANCKNGKNQSPVDLSAMVEADLPALMFHYQKGGNQILNNGHTVQVNYKPGSMMMVDGRHYELKQFHFHSPSENTIKGESFPMEAHLVHADKAGNLAVVALMFREGSENAELAKAWQQMPHAKQKESLKAAVDINALLPESKEYYRFTGSLTTPPCSEGVTWLVMKEVLSASKEQVAHFSHTMHHANNRPVQPKNARVILQ